MGRKELKNIFLVGMPREQIRHLEKNLKGQSDLRLFIAETPEELWDGSFQEEALQAADNGLVISGCREALLMAADRGIAFILYQEAGGLEWTFPEDMDWRMAVEGFEEVDARFLVRVFERAHHIPWKILNTRRCIVREFELRDLDALFALYSYPGMTDHMEGLYPYEKEMEYQKAYIDNMYRFYGFGMWLVFERSTGELIGRAGIECREELGGQLELGYAVGTPFQRKGYAKEVCRAILDYVKEELDYNEIFCLIEEGNHASVHLAEKLGFRYQMVVTIGGRRMLEYLLKLQ